VYAVLAKKVSVWLTTRDAVQVTTRDAVQVTTQDAVQVTTRDAVQITTRDAVQITTREHSALQHDWFVGRNHKVAHGLIYTHLESVSPHP
jgi:hypothetical protein